MSEHVDMEWREVALFLLEWERRRDPWEKAMSCFGEGILRGALPQGSGGREDEGELEKTSVPWGLQLCAGMGTLGETHETTVGEEQGAHPLETNTQREMSRSGEESSEDEEKCVGKILGSEVLWMT